MFIIELEWTSTACPFQAIGKTADNRPVYIRERGGPTRIKIGNGGQDVKDLFERDEPYRLIEIDFTPQSLNHLIDHINDNVENLFVQDCCRLSDKEDNRFGGLFIDNMEKTVKMLILYKCSQCPHFRMNSNGSYDCHHPKYPFPKGHGNLGDNKPDCIDDNCPLQDYTPQRKDSGSAERTTENNSQRQPLSR